MVLERSEAEPFDAKRILNDIVREVILVMKTLNTKALVWPGASLKGIFSCTLIAKVSLGRDQ